MDSHALHTGMHIAACPFRDFTVLFSVVFPSSSGSISDRSCARVISQFIIISDCILNLLLWFVAAANLLHIAHLLCAVLPASPPSLVH